jgi:AcrR family transcriptional regulator
MAKTSKQDPKTRILDAAENAFANFGFDGASLRQIVRAAGVNLPTVYYYFGSKEGLMTAAINRRFDPLRPEHLALLQQVEQEARGKKLPLEKVLEAMLLPPLRLADHGAAQTPVVMRLIGRIVTEPNPQTQDLLRNQYADVRQAFLDALRRSLPRLPATDLRWRFEFIWGALAFTLTNPRKIERESGGACNPSDTKTVVAQMIRFFAAGLRAPGVS